MVKKLEDSKKKDNKEQMKLNKIISQQNNKIPYNLIFSVCKKLKQFKEEKNYRIRKDYNDYIYICPNLICKEKNITFVHKFSFVKHWRNRHSQNYPKCKFCKRAFAFLNKHEKVCSKRNNIISNMNKIVKEDKFCNDKNVLFHELKNNNNEKNLIDCDIKLPDNKFTNLNKNQTLNKSIINLSFSSDEIISIDKNNTIIENKSILQKRLFQENINFKHKKKTFFDKERIPKNFFQKNDKKYKKNSTNKDVQIEITCGENIKTEKEQKKDYQKSKENFSIIDEQSVKKNFFLQMIDNHQAIDIGSYLYFKNFLIGEGTFKNVYFGLEKISHNPCVVFELKKNKNGKNYFYKDFTISKHLENLNFFPKAKCYFQLNENQYMISTLKGPTLDKFIYFTDKNCKISKNTAYRIGIELLYNLKLLHENGVLHLDIKGDNFILQDEPKIIENETIHFCLTDFGYSLKYKNDKTKIYSGKKLNRCGNYCYASMNELNYEKVSRRDDIISASLFIFDLCIGYKLPWEDFSRPNYSELRHAVIESKKKFDINKFYKGKFTEIKNIYKEANNLKIGEEPNYNKYISILKDAIKNDYSNDGNIINFDWEKKIVDKVKKSKMNKTSLEEDQDLMLLFQGFPFSYQKKYINSFFK